MLCNVKHNKEEIERLHDVVFAFDHRLWQAIIIKTLVLVPSTPEKRGNPIPPLSHDYFLKIALRFLTIADQKS